MKPITLIILLVFSTPLFAQNDTLITNNDYKWKIGVKGMVERTTKSPMNRYDYISVFNFGIQFIYKLNSNNKFIESGLYYLKKPFNEPYLYEYQIKDNIITLNYIHTPIKYRIEKKLFYISFGCYIEYLAGVRAENKNRFESLEKFYTDFRDFSFGVTGSLGIEKNINKEIAFFIETNLSEGISDIQKHNSFSVLTNLSSFRSYGLNFGLNYKFN